jgi:predicted nuclease of predicted toxin-antitoxin system
VIAKLLLDENLSPKVAQLRCEDGIDAIHVRDIGLLGGTDAQVFGAAFADDRVVVTMHVADFAKLARARDEAHAFGRLHGRREQA